MRAGREEKKTEGEEEEEDHEWCCSNVPGEDGELEHDAEFEAELLDDRGGDEASSGKDEVPNDPKTSPKTPPRHHKKIPT